MITETQSSIRAAAEPPSRGLASNESQPCPTEAGRPHNRANMGKWNTAPAFQDLPTVLLLNEMVTPEHLQWALNTQRREGGFLGDILVDEGLIDEDAFVAFLAKHYKIPHICLCSYCLDEALLSLISRDICLERHVVPLDRLGKSLTLAMVNPFDRAAFELINHRCPNLHVRPILCTRRHFEKVAHDTIERRHRIGEACGPQRRRGDLLEAQSA